MQYLGVKPPELNVPLIELESSEGELVDLYNDGTLLKVTLDGRGLAFEFSTDEGRRILVRFSDVRNLRVEQPSDWVPEESGQIEHLLIRDEGPWPGVVFKAGGLEYEFDCRALCLSSATD